MFVCISPMAVMEKVASSKEFEFGDFRFPILLIIIAQHLRSSCRRANIKGEAKAFVSVWLVCWQCDKKQRYIRTTRIASGWSPVCRALPQL